MQRKQKCFHASIATRSVVVMILGGICLTSAAQAQSDTDSVTYARYTHPGQCVALGARLTSRFWRDKRADTIRYHPESDSVLISVRRAVRACATRFSIATTVPRDWLDLLRVQLWLGQIDSARATEQKLITEESARRAVERGWTLYRIFQAYLGAKPTQLIDAVRVLKQLDAMHVPAAPWRALAHAELGAYRMSVNQGTEALAEEQAAIATYRSMARADRTDRISDIWGAWKGLVEVTSIQLGGHAAVATLDTAARELVPLLGPPATGAMLDNGRAQAMLRQNITRARSSYEILGTSPPPIVATHWSDEHGDPAVRPKPKVVTLIMLISPNCGGLCFPEYATLRRLETAYRAKGLQIVLLGKTQGDFKGHLFPQPASEAVQMHRYVFEFLQLHGLLGIWETKFSFIADGRRSDEVWASQEAYLRGWNAAIVDGNGTIKVVTKISPTRERMLGAQIAALLEQGSAELHAARSTIQSN